MRNNTNVMVLNAYALQGLFYKIGEKMKNNYFEKLYNKTNGNYNLGLDIGTNSIGWAIHDDIYKLIDFGVYLDPKKEDSKENRSKRSARRNQRRKTYRLNMLENLAIEKKLIEPNLKEQTKYNMFDKYFRDKREQEKYEIFFPTIYHLKKKAINFKVTKEDMFLCLYHTLKLRGHFLSESISYENIKESNSESDKLIQSWLDERYGLNNFESFFEEIIQITKDYTSSKERKKALEDAYDNADKIEIEDNKDNKKNLVDEILFILGYSKSLNNIKEMPTDDKGKVKSFKIENIDEQVDLPEVIYDLEKIASILEVKRILGNDNETLSEELVTKYHKYSQYKEDGTINLDYEENIKLFEEENKDFVKAAQAGFEKKLKETKSNKKFKIRYLRNFENRKLPNQLYYDEAMKIIKKQKEYYPEILDDDFVTKYQQLVRARIPYYVGPLAQSTDYSKNAWLERQEDAINIPNITPYNINEINHAKVNEEFINRMVKLDPYFRGENIFVLPSRSYTYEYFKVLSDMSNFVITDESGESRHLTKEEKIILLNKFYKTKNATSVTRKKVEEAIENCLNFVNPKLYNDKVVDTTIYANLKTYIECNVILDLDLNNEKLDELAKILTLFEDAKLKKREVTKFFQENDIIKTEKEIKEICRLKYKGYGEYSNKLLNEELFEVENEQDTLLNHLLNKDVRFNEILKENIQNQEKYYQDKFKSKLKLDYSLVEDMYGSNIVKSNLNNLFIVMNELHKIYGTPKSITVEMAREEGVKKQTKSREEQMKEQIKILKKNLNSSYDKSWMLELEDHLNSGKKIHDKILLYFQQGGKDIYSMENGQFKDLDFEKIMRNDSEYDTDHIVPYSFNFDNSLNNRVLVHNQYNAKKGNKLPLEFIEKSNHEKYEAYINFLRQKKIISAAKRDNLLITDLGRYMNQGFKNSQLNDTRHITKEIVAILKAFYDAKGQKVNVNTMNANVAKPIMSKTQIIKIREITDKHHAIDAYLISIIFNAIKKKFPWVDSKYATVKKEKLKEGQKLFKKEDVLDKRYTFINDIYSDINGDDLISIIDNKQYKRVYKVRKKVTGQFWDQNFGNKNEQDKIANLLVHRRDNNKRAQVITSGKNVRVDIFRKNNKNYMFAVPTSYFQKNGNTIKLIKAAYKHGLNVMNKKIWNKKNKKNENITINDFKYSLWYNDMFKVGDETYFRNGARQGSQNIEGRILSERDLSLVQIQELLRELKEGEVNKYRWATKNEIFKKILDEEGKKFKFNSKPDGTSKKTISILNMNYWYQYKEFVENNRDCEFYPSQEQKEYIQQIYDTPQKHEIAQKYFFKVINNENFAIIENKAVKKEFENIFGKLIKIDESDKKIKIKDEIDFARIASLNIFQIIGEYNKTFEKNKQLRHFISVSKVDIKKIVQSPLGHKQRIITQENFENLFDSFEIR